MARSVLLNNIAETLAIYNYCKYYASLFSGYSPLIMKPPTRERVVKSRGKDQVSRGVEGENNSNFIEV